MNPCFVVAANWKDRWFLPACIYSIRKNYPEAKIFLLKDTYRGDFSTHNVENVFNVTIIDKTLSFGGGGWVKILPALRGKFAEYFQYPLMILDADVIVQGRVFEDLLKVEGDVIVSPDLNAFGGSSEYISQTYLSVDCLHQMGYSPEQISAFPWFNSGHMLVREPYVENEFSQKWIDWNSSPVSRMDNKLYPLTDQSFLNHYLLSNTQVSLGVLDFADWAGEEQIKTGERSCDTYPYSPERVLHYAGLASVPYWKMPNWKVFSKYNKSAERLLGKRGRLAISHSFQSFSKRVLGAIGPANRAKIKGMLFSK
ncbi:MAG: hypothetical protein ACQKBU_04160 [Verrucomicrobiales bacterium]